MIVYWARQKNFFDSRYEIEEIEVEEHPVNIDGKMCYVCTSNGIGGKISVSTEVCFTERGKAVHYLANEAQKDVYALIEQISRLRESV